MHPLYSITPGIQVNVVNSYSAISDEVFVIFVSNVDFPTDGKPIKQLLKIREK